MSYLAKTKKDDLFELATELREQTKDSIKVFYLRD